MSSPSQKFFYLFPWTLFLNFIVLISLGLINLYSATGSLPGKASSYFQSQLMWAVLGLGVMFTMLVFHYRRLQELAWPIYAFSLLLLILVVFIGASGGGQKNWLVLGPIRLQPSELAKLAVIIMAAYYFSKASFNLEASSLITQLKLLRIPSLLFLLPLGLVLIEKDLGSALFFILIALSFLFFIGIKKRILAGALLGLMMLGGISYAYFLKPYQKARIQTFLNPGSDPQGQGYHLLQSKIAVGSGRLLGQGYAQGNLNKLKFLPERHTDFVFPVLAEEWGFVGSGLVLIVFVTFFLLLLQGVGKLQDPFGRYLSFGVTAWLFWQWSLNLGGVLGLLPLAGVTLPFFSYGGSALLTNCLALGLVFNVWMRRYVF